MLIAGGKIIALFLVVFPLQLMLLLHHSWWLFTVLPSACVLFYYTCQCITPPQLKSQQRTCVTKRIFGTPFNGIVLGTGLVLTVHLVVALAMNWLLQTGCLPCLTGQGLARKPALVAHRGCDFTFPENTLAAFRECVKIPGIVAIETDVQISLDGVPFILHDPHLVRTTDAEKRCPTVNPLSNATWLNFSDGDCPLQELRVGLQHAKVHIPMVTVHCCVLSRILSMRGLLGN